MLELMLPQALNFVEMAVAESISRVIRVPITLKMGRYITGKSTVLIVLSFRVQRRFNLYFRLVSLLIDPRP